MAEGEGEGAGQLRFLAIWGPRQFFPHWPDHLLLSHRPLAFSFHHSSLLGPSAAPREKEGLPALLWLTFLPFPGPA